MSASNIKQQASDGRADFDFFMGSWKIQNRILRERLKDSTSWEEFGGTSVARKILAGLGHLEEFTMDRASGATEGVAVRLFDPKTQQWSVSAADNRNGFDPRPAIGAFKDGRFECYSHEPWEGQYIFCRVIWSEITATSFHWEQAFSADGGRTWETNWIADFVRSEEPGSAARGRPAGACPAAPGQDAQPSLSERFTPCPANGRASDLAYLFGQQGRAASHLGGTMKIGLGLPESIPGVRGQFILDWARKAEAGPFSSLSVFDRLVYANYEPLVTLAAVAAVTQRVRLVTSVLLAPLRNPAMLAKMVASLDALSNGRLSLGLGIGGRADDFQAAGVPLQQRARRFEEQLTLLKHIWSDQPVSEYVGAIGPPVVSPRGPELLIGGYAPQAVRRVGKWGDGFIAGLVSPARALSLYHQAEASWEEAKRPGKPRFVGAFLFALGPNALERAGHYLKHYFGAEGLSQPIPAAPEGVRAAIEARLHVGMDEVLLWPCLADFDQIDRAAEIVNDLLRRDMPA